MLYEHDHQTMTTDVDSSLGTLKSVEKAFRVIELLRREDGAGVTRVADELGWAKSTAHNYLRTLEENEYVVQEGSTYYLGLRFLGLGTYVKNRKEIYSLAETKVEELAERTNERAQFVVNEHGKAIYVRHMTGDRGVQTDARIGSRLDLHATSSGKALLSQLSADERAKLLDRIELTQFTENTITDREELREELKRIRDRNIAHNRGEIVKGMNAVAVPVTDSNEEVIGALSVSGPAHRMTDEWIENELAEYILGTANELELNIEYR